MQQPVDVDAVRALLRQLAIGLSVHRLYPGDLHTSAFVAAAGRINAAVADAMADGAIRVEVRSGRFLLDGEPIHADGVDRLAEACFERRVEHLGFDAVPTLEDLGTLFELLSTDAATLEREGGVAAALSARGVTTVRATAGAPEPTSGEEVSEQVLGLADREETVDEEVVDAGIALELEPGEGALELYDRLARLATDLPPDGSQRTSFFQRANWLVESLPLDERARFGRRLIDRLSIERFAERYAGHLTDVAFAGLIADVAHRQGIDPVALAVEVGATAGRHTTLQQLLATAPGGSGEALPPGAEGYPEDDRLRDAFRQVDEEPYRLAARALVDVLLNQPRQEQFERILDNAAEQLGAAVAGGHFGAAQDLLEALATVQEVGPERIATRVGQPRSRALTAPIVADAVKATAAGGRKLDPQDFGAFGGAAIEPIIGALAQDPTSRTAAWLVDALVLLSTEHLDVLQAALGRQRSDVVASLIPVIGRVGGPETVTVLARLALRDEPDVLHAIVQALERQDPPSAAPAIALICRRTADKPLRNLCLDTLGRLPGAAARTHLQQLAERNPGPALPWSARRRARRLARGSGAS